MIKKEQSLIESQIFPARELFFPMLQKIKTKFFSSSFISIHIDVKNPCYRTRTILYELLHVSTPSEIKRVRYENIMINLGIIAHYFQLR